MPIFTIQMKKNKKLAYLTYIQPLSYQTETILTQMNSEILTLGPIALESIGVIYMSRPITV